MYYLKRMQAFPPVEADLILAQAIKLKITHIQKYDKPELKYTEDKESKDNREIKEIKPKTEEKHEPKKEEATPKKIEEKQNNDTPKLKSDEKPCDANKYREEKHDAVATKISETRGSVKDILKAKPEKMPPELYKNSSNDTYKNAGKFNPLESISHRASDMGSAIQMINSCINNLKTEE